MRLLKHKHALIILSVAAALDVVSGILFAVAQGIAVWSGVYFAIVTATTVGYGDVTPHGWAAHIIAVVIMLTIIPLFAAAFSLITTSLTTTHIDKRHEEMKNHVTAAMQANQGSNDAG